LDSACTHHRSFYRPWSPNNLADPNAPFFCCHAVEAFRMLGPSGPDYHVVLSDDNCANAETALLHEKAGRWSLIIHGTTLTPLVQPSPTTWCPVAAASSSLVRHTECASLAVCCTHRHIVPWLQIDSFMECRLIDYRHGRMRVWKIFPVDH
jgi:hypothetical protein